MNNNIAFLLSLFDFGPTVCKEPNTKPFINYKREGNKQNKHGPTKQRLVTLIGYPSFNPSLLRMRVRSSQQ